MQLTLFKNTVLLFLLLGISCANSNKTKLSSNNTISNEVEVIKTDTTKTKKQPIIVGANLTKTYLKLLEGKRVGVVANQTSVIFKAKSYTHLVDSLVSLKIDVKKVFSPEHGFRGNFDAGELVKDGLDTKTGLPIFSLHGKNKKPPKEQLANLDVVVFDIQDVGVRFYTYISTLHHVMEACAENNISVIVLDRPNPNGNYVDGPTMEAKHTSFLGMHTIPLVHGLTIGEYATMINGEQWLANNITCDLKVVKMMHYTHNKSYSLPLRPSPNLPNDLSIKLYPSLGLFEGTTVNAGRGSEFQFQRYGAPFLDSTKFSFSYTPKENFGAKYPKHKNKLCFGEDLSSEKTKDSITLKYIIKAYNGSNNKEKFFLTSSFTKHSGTTELQKQIQAGWTEAKIKATWESGLESFKLMRTKYLLYN